SVVSSDFLSFPTRRSSDLGSVSWTPLAKADAGIVVQDPYFHNSEYPHLQKSVPGFGSQPLVWPPYHPLPIAHHSLPNYEIRVCRSEEHTSELQSRENHVCS